MVLDRQYQNELLNFLSQDYPEYEHAHEHCQELYITDRLKYIGNVDYLQQHGLLRDGVLLRHAWMAQLLLVLLPSRQSQKRE